MRCLMMISNNHQWETEMNIQQFRKTHRLVTPGAFMNNEDRPIDLDGIYAGARIHRHDFKWPDGVSTPYHIIECRDGFHFWFSHPCDEIAPSLAEAQRLQFESIVE